MRGVERGGAVQQHHRHHVLQADVGHVAVVHHRGDRRRHPHAHLAHLIRRKRCAGTDRGHGIERRLDRRADGPFLDVGLGDLVALAQLLDQTLRVRLRRIGLEKIVRAGKNVVDAVPARGHQQRGRHAVARGHAGEHERLLDVVGVAPPRNNS